MLSAATYAGAMPVWGIAKIRFMSGHSFKIMWFTSARCAPTMLNGNVLKCFNTAIVFIFCSVGCNFPQNKKTHKKKGQHLRNQLQAASS